jgi:hypothetical protein
VRRVFNRAFFGVGYKVMWLFVWKIAPPFPLKPNVQPSDMCFISGVHKEGACFESQ